MATELFRKRMIEAYRELRNPDLFLSGLFTVRPGNISMAEKIAIDIERWDEDVAPVVNVCEGPNFVTTDQFTTKEFIPPAYEEAMPFNCYDLLKRLPGQTEYDASNVEFQAQLVQRIMQGMIKLENRILRGMELQASQVLQTGTLTLWGADGNTAYNIDFKPKTTHFPTAGTAWGAAGADPLGDLESLADVIRDDGLQDANIVIMGSKAFSAFIDDDKVAKRFDNRRYEQGMIAPQLNGVGGKRQGSVEVGNYRFEIWTYNGRYLESDNTTKKTFIDPGKVVMLGETTRLDKMFGAVPRAVPVDPRFAGFLPDRIAVPEAIDLSPNIYGTPNGRQQILEVASRPLCVPTAIDGFGCLDTQL